MKKSTLVVLAVAAGLVWGLMPFAAAGPSLPVTKPPVLDPTILTGPIGDPPALMGQWFMVDEGESFRPNEFHDNVLMLGGGLAGENAIFGYVDSIDYLGGIPGNDITNFTILATINNDLVESDAEYAGSNSHGESRTNIGSYVGSLLDTMLVAEFAVVDSTLLPPQPFVPPYRETTPLIEAVNEDEAAWYCWSPTDPLHTPHGAFYVPAWYFGNIPLGNLSSRQLVFAVPAGLPSTDPRYSAIVDSYNTTNDILLNRTLSLKISTWIDELIRDFGMFQEELPYRHSDVSVFHYIESEEQDLDFGDAPDPAYPTLLANDGARHVIDPAVFMGLLIDAETDGQPDATATGDDLANTNDEDGVAFLAPLVGGASVTVQVTVSTSGYISAWVDFGADGAWIETVDQILSATNVPGAGTYNFSFTVPPVVKATNTFARFRFTTLSVAVSYTGLVANGEVEDYEVDLFAEGEGPTMDFGDATDSLVVPGYPTLLANNGARHTVVPVTYLGFTIDREPDGQPDGTATGDDNNPPAGIDDEDGVLLPPAFVAGSTAQVLVIASAPGFLNAWIDWNANGTWIDPFEQVFTNQPLMPGPNPLAVPVPLPPILVAGGPHSRWRFTSYPPAPPLFFGPEADGEVEDYEVRLQVLDFGDAPDASYQTLLASDGARHLIPSAYYLGLAAPDLDPDGRPSAGADGDDLDSTDDEDGVFVGVGQSLVQGDPSAVLGVIASVSGYLNAWLDFDQDGAWNGGSEWIATDVLLSAGVSPLVFSIPATAQLGPTIGRFRFASAAGLGSTGLAADGEVEDHVFTIYQTGPTNPAGFLITNIVVEMSNSTYAILWDGETNVTYETQYRTNLVSTDAPPWTAWGAYVTGPPWTQTDSNTVDTSKFYRVIAPYISP